MARADKAIKPVLSYRLLLRDAAILLALTLAAAAACSLVGVAKLSWPVWTMRLTRLAMAATVGAGLASAGMALQALLRNPLAEPYILGVSSGAGVGVLVGSVLAGTIGLAAWVSTPVLALIGAVCPEPELLVLDEPTSGLDPIVRREFIQTVIGAYHAGDPEHRTVFVSTHLISEFEGLIDEFTIALSPVLFGSGIRLFEGVDAGRVALEPVRAEPTRRVTHLTYAVRER